MLNAVELYERLQVRYKEPEWALFEQVPNSTGAVPTRWADAMAMNLWPSRGLTVIGFEIKVSRADWLREVRAPAKVEQGIYKYCDHWYVLVNDKKIVQGAELPDTWGLMAPYGKGLRAYIEAPRLKPVSLGRGFVASVLRRAARSPTDSRTTRERDIWQSAFQKGRDAEASKVTMAQAKLADYVKNVTEFENASGIDIRRGWDLPNIGNAVRLIVGRGWSHGPLEQRLRRFVDMGKQIHSHSLEVEKALDELKKIEEQETT
jgi:hypothetical protein